MKKLYLFLPPLSRVFCLLGAVALFMHILSLCFRTVADLLLKTVGAFVRSLLGYVSAPLPFSLAEMLLLGLPLWIALLLCLARRYLKKGGSPRRAIAFTLSFLPLISVYSNDILLPVVL